MSPKVMGTPGELVSWAQAAKMLRVGVQTVAKISNQGMLTPVWKGRKRFFHRVDVVALMQIFNGKTDFASVANLAMRAFLRAEQCEKKLTELLDILGFTSVPLDITEKGVTSLYAQALALREEQSPVFIAAEIYMFAKRVLATTEEYFTLVEKITKDAEPWRAFLDACQQLLELAPREAMRLDHELTAAYGFLEAARKHIRCVAYFYVRRSHGAKAARDAFIGDGAYSPLITTLFSN